MPRIEIEGLELAPGRKHKIDYRKKKAFFLSSPYTTCTETVSRSMQATIDPYGGADYGYSETLCYTHCKQAYV